jgi:hypothetical protein
VTTVASTRFVRIFRSPATRTSGVHFTHLRERPAERNGRHQTAEDTPKCVFTSTKMG